MVIVNELVCERRKAMAAERLYVTPKLKMPTLRHPSSSRSLPQ